MKIVSLTIQKKSPKYFRERTVIYISPEGETILEQLDTRRNKPYTVYRKQFLPEILKQAGYPADTKVSWSQKAGCGCGCSPGFIVKNEMGTDIFVTVSD